MRRVIYTSRSAMEDDGARLDEIVERAAVRNQADGITGMLWSDGVSFVQVLEGGEEAVGATMARILGDRRHQGVTIVVDVFVTRRMFDGWGMRRADVGVPCTERTAFLVGCAASAGTAAARRLVEVVARSEDRVPG